MAIATQKFNKNNFYGRNYESQYSFCENSKQFVIDPAEIAIGIPFVARYYVIQSDNHFFGGESWRQDFLILDKKIYTRRYNAEKNCQLWGHQPSTTGYWTESKIEWLSY